MAFLGDGLVIRRKAVVHLDDAGGGGGGGGTGDINLSNILKLVPGDIVAIYLAGQGISASPVMNMKWPALLFYLCLIVCVALRVLVTAKTERGINWILVVVTAIAFFIWAHAVAPTEGPVIAGFFGSVAGFVAMLFGVLAPVLVPAEPQP